MKTTQAQIKKAHVFIQKFFQANGYAPTIAELANGLSCSTYLVSLYLIHLESQGLIERAPHSPRSIRLVK